MVLAHAAQIPSTRGAIASSSASSGVLGEVAGAGRLRVPDHSDPHRPGTPLRRSPPAGGTPLARGARRSAARRTRRAPHIDQLPAPRAAAAPSEVSPSCGPYPLGGAISSLGFIQSCPLPALYRSYGLGRFRPLRSPQVEAFEQAWSGGEVDSPRLHQGGYTTIQERNAVGARSHSSHSR